MPPEAFEGKSGARGDVYSLGLTLYELLALSPAFGEKERGRLVHQVTTEEAPRLEKVNPDIPRDLETIVHKAIEREPAHRYTTAGELAADLQRFLDDEPIQARRATPMERCARWCRRNRLVASLAASLIGLLIAATVGSLIGLARMSRLAKSQGLAAERELAARLVATEQKDAAEKARRHEAAQRRLADESRRQAETALYDAKVQRDRAEANFAKAGFQLSEGSTLWFDPDPAGTGEALAPYDEVFARVVQARPEDRNLLIARFHYFGSHHRWREADEMVARIIELDPVDGQARDYHRALLLFTGDLEGYRWACREEEARLVAEGKDARAAQFLGQYRSNRPRDAGPPLPAPAPPADLLAARLHGGIRDYRQGQFTAAVRQLAAVPGLTKHPLKLTLAQLFLAMAHQRLGQVTEARRELEAARTWHDWLGRIHRWEVRDSTEGQELMDYRWTERLIVTILRREAEALIVYDPIFPADPFAR